MVGARPNFVKMAPVLEGLTAQGVGFRLLHTGQHYDRALSDDFIERLGMRAPDANLGAGSGSHGEQTAAVMVGVEQELQEHPATLVLVAGDVNSTMAAALAASKLQIAVAHVESGLRSRDWTMPEEVNRVVTDRVSELLFCTSADAVDNLAAEGIAGGRVQLVGNTMIDSLQRMLTGVDRDAVLAEQDVGARGFTLVTLHRPALVDDPVRLGAVIEVLAGVAERLPVLFPAHPRTLRGLREAGVEPPPGLRLMDPLDYDRFIALEAEARLVITDSGGVQEETSVLGVPCITYRTTTERPITTEFGTNRLVGVNPEALAAACAAELEREPPADPPRIPLWDGHAGTRAAGAIAEWVLR